MKKVTSVLLSSIGSALTAGLVGYFVSKKIYTKKADEEKEKVAASLRKYYNDNYVLKNDPLKKPKITIEEARKKEPYVKECPMELVNQQKESINSKTGLKCDSTNSFSEEKRDMENYVNYAKKYQTKPSKNTIDEAEKKEPYIISGEEEAFSIKQEIIPYVVYSDKKIADDNYALVKDPSKKFGKKNLDTIFSSEDVIYIHDPELNKVYEIVKEDRTYKDAAGKYAGVFPESEEDSNEDPYSEDDEIEDEYGDYADRFDR